jgi:chemotaxis protein methyltransferase CheR
MNAPGTAIALTDAELKLLQALIYRECGMYFDERRTHFLRDRLHRRLRECQMESFYGYYVLLTSPQGRDELVRLVENLTVNETSFFRNRAQLDLFGKHLLPAILRQKADAGDTTLRLWSAGCSTGQEPYTMAMLLGDAISYFVLRKPLLDATLPRPLVPAPWKVEIVASDINYSVLRSGQDGSYSETQMAPVDYSYRLRFFDRVGDRYVVRKALRELIHFDFHNLKTDFLPRAYDMIFCRNVMMYFDDAEQKRLVDKFYRCLRPEGYLFVGHAESLLGLTQKFAMVHRNQGTAYQRVEVAS